jgi:hypothetical protein
VTCNEHGFRFSSSERAFDSLEGREFRSARDAERAARALLAERHVSATPPRVAVAFRAAQQKSRKDGSMITRRKILGATLAVAALAISPSSVEDQPIEIRKAAVRMDQG